MIGRGVVPPGVSLATSRMKTNRDEAGCWI